MRQISQNYKTGEIKLEKLSPPTLRSGGVLVYSLYSVVSTGTEGMKVREGKMNYLQKAKARPDHVKKVLQSVKQQGIQATYQKVMNKLDSLTPLGYSLSGRVIAVGKGAEEFHVGQLVACAGAGYANHGEINFIPKNLTIPIPDSVLPQHAAFATLGAIALHGYRQAKMQLGETALIIGLGLIGQLLLQILQAAGIKVFGIDISDDRCEIARQQGAIFASTANDPTIKTQIMSLTQGIGIDCIFITAGGNSNKPVEIASSMARDRGKIVDIGITKMDLPWKGYYEKELEVIFSRSYGPGRYDTNYEERGIDYPIGYVRWTERRNMQSFLDLLAAHKLDLSPLLTSIYSFSDAEKVYQKLATGDNTKLGVLFQYPDKHQELKGKIVRSIEVSHPSVPVTPVKLLKLGVIGAGNYASTMLLPHLCKIQQVQLVEVATATSLSAKNAFDKFNFTRFSTDYKSILSAEDIDAVLIATRHESHAELVCEALNAGKAVFVEKPLAISLNELQKVQTTINGIGNERLLVGFNRRFSPALITTKKLLNTIKTPLVINYRVHAGKLDEASWYMDPENGSRFVGEAGHFFDLFSYLIGNRPTSVIARNIRTDNLNTDDIENIATIIQYSDGSIANLLYLTQGGSQTPKEYIEIYGAGMTVQIHNFKNIHVYEGTSSKKIKLNGTDKGQQEEMTAFVDAIVNGSEMPITVQSLLDTTELTLLAWDSASSGLSNKIKDKPSK